MTFGFHVNMMYHKRNRASFFCTAVLAAGLVATTAPGEGSITEKGLFEEIRRHASKRSHGELHKSARRFFKTYPKSALVPDVRLYLAETETDPERAIALYRVLVDKYRYYRNRDYALLKICHIHHLLSRYEDLLKEAYRGLKLFPDSRYRFEFALLHVTAGYKTGRYGAAEEECLDLVENERSHGRISRSLLLLTFLQKKTTGYSRRYIYNLRELAIGFKKSDIHQSILYLLGEFYEERKDYNRAWSAYSDLTRQYPGSPESAIARTRLRYLARFKPRRAPYVPDKKLVRNAETIDIHPEREIIEDGRDSPVTHALSIGPFETLSRAKTIKNLVREYGSPRLVLMNRGYVVYVGFYPDLDRAFETRVRLAEEHGINGRIVRIVGDKSKRYIYED